jgi:hypothetical protein
MTIDADAGEGTGKSLINVLPFDIAVARARRRLRRIALDRALTRTLSAALVGWIALGIPLLTANFGVAGLLRGVGIALMTALAIATMVAGALTVLGVRLLSALRAAAPLISPFGTARASEMLVRAAITDVTAGAQMAALLGDHRFLESIRPAAYDILNEGPVTAALHTPTEMTTLTAIVQALPEFLLERAIGAPRTTDEITAGSYCPRCGTHYERDVLTCSDCVAIPLQPHRRVNEGRGHIIP